MLSNPTSPYKADTIDLVAAWLVVWRYKYLIALMVSIVVAATVVLALRMTPIYRAEVVVVPTRDGGAGDAGSLGSRLGGLASIAGLNLGSRGGDNADALAVLRSRFLIEQFIARNNLVADLVSGDERSSSLWFAVDRFREKVPSIRTRTRHDHDRHPVDGSGHRRALGKRLRRAGQRDHAHAGARRIEPQHRVPEEQIAKTNVVELQRVMYEVVEDETKNHMLANVRKQYAFAIVDPAVSPEKRVWPKRTLMVLTGGVLGVVLGILLALCLDMWAQYRSRSDGQPGFRAEIAARSRRERLADALLIRLWRHLSERRRRQFVMHMGLMVVSVITELVSLGAVLPFIAVLASPERVFRNRMIADVARSFGIDSGRELVLPLTIAFAARRCSPGRFACWSCGSIHGSLRRAAPS